MPPKRHKKQKAKIEPAIAQETLLSKTTKKARRIFQQMSMRSAWRFLTAVSVLLNFVFVYVVFSSDVTIDYSSHLIPENPIALPIKVTNMGELPIYNVRLEIIDDLYDKTNKNTIVGNKGEIYLCDRLGRHKYTEHIYGPIFINNPTVNWVGAVYLSVSYQTFFRFNVISEKQKFSIFKSKDGYFKWVSSEP